MKSSKHFPNSLRELAKFIKLYITKKGAKQDLMLSSADENQTIENVLRRMNEKGMFTRKTRTGESKEHAKDHVKLKFSDIIELFKRDEKEDIGIVFESSFAFPIS